MDSQQRKETQRQETSLASEHAIVELYEEDDWPDFWDRISRFTKQSPIQHIVGGER